MYLRSKLQQRALENLNTYTQKEFHGMRVTKGYVISRLLENYSRYTEDAEKLKKAIIESDIKQEGSGTAVNLNITVAANEKLLDLKRVLDKETGRSLFPAQILDILLICALKKNEEAENSVRDVSNKELARILLDYAYKLLAEDVTPINISNSRNEIVRVLTSNFLL